MGSACTRQYPGSSGPSEERHSKPPRSFQVKEKDSFALRFGLSWG